jgi:hypothetical protein
MVATVELWTERDHVYPGSGAGESTERCAVRRDSTGSCLEQRIVAEAQASSAPAKT